MGDVADAVAALVDSGVAGAVNVGSVAVVSVCEILERIGRLTRRGAPINFCARALAATEPAVIAADVARLRGEVGFHPRYDLDQGLDQTLAAYKSEFL